ncbi:copper resistance protein CopC [Brevibacillus sp. H7]|uniref:copper resistance protein CopC n=1 Tax=Brevibacillus sp. H7 TaxID=3349138 RepID=UPI0037FE4D0E
MKRTLRLVYLLVLFLAAIPSTMDAHAYIDRSLPQQESELTEAPKEIRVTFTENINTAVSQLTLRDAIGRSIQGTLRGEGENGLVLTVPPLANGVYQVDWQILSVDTHVTEGSFRFAVGVPLPKNRPAETLSLDGSVQPEQPDQPDASIQEVETPVSQPAAGSIQAPASDSKPQSAPQSAKPPVNQKKQPTKPAENGSPGTAPVPSTAAPAASTASMATPATEAAASAAVTASPPPASPEQVEVVQAGETVQGHVHTAAPQHFHEEHEGHEGWGRWLRIAEILAGGAVGALVFLSVWQGFITHFPASSGFVSVERGGYLICLGIFMVAGMLQVNLLAEMFAGSAGREEMAGTLLTATTLGTASWLRPVLVLILAGLSFLPFSQHVSIRWGKLALVTVLFLTFPLTGHAMSDAGWSTLTVFAHTVHIWTAVIWLGGLSGLTWLSFTAAQEKTSLHDLHRLLGQFSRIALFSVLIVSATGILLGAFRLGHWNQLGASDYGAVLLAKVAFFVVALELALVHRFVFLPRLASLSEEQTARTSSVGALFWTLRIEFVAGLVVLILAGIVSTTPPPQIAL